MSIYEKKAILPTELLSFMYGSLVVRLTKDIQDTNEINKKIEELGFNIGKRYIDEIIDTLGKSVDSSNPELVVRLVTTLLKQNCGYSL